MMKSKLVPTIVKGMLVGAAIGGGAAYITGMDLTCKCRKMKKTAGRAYKCMCKVVKNTAAKIM